MTRLRWTILEIVATWHTEAAGQGACITLHTLMLAITVQNIAVQRKMIRIEDHSPMLSKTYIDTYLAQCQLELNDRTKLALSHLDINIKE